MTADPIRPWLAEMSAAELATREMHLPRQVQQGKKSQEQADSDIAAWRAIAALLANGEAESGLSWAELEHAAGIAFAKLCEVADAKPGDTALRDRREAVQAILARLRWHREQAMALPTGQGRLAA